ncbi:MAG: PhnA domain-containing protein [Moritella sp.]|uniref:PhnA domain-containing protein n=1 Tax=unclassified Moritella TaxID=2637987 RepID=UPI000156836A|nr:MULTISPECIES: alkylphosphonate utilization protein [unclassified Moritella]EDM68037.1 putative phnA protein [Moritella sp. PE36]MBL1417669.1 PhnA domain-containing protein [Moritella sp.]
MTIETTLLQRSGSKCEMCTAESNLTAYELPESPEKSSDCAVMLCGTCLEQINNSDTLDENHWRCLNDSMWSQVPAVQVLAYRMLSRLDADWSRDLLDMMYLEEDVKAWAEKGVLIAAMTDTPARDVNGTILKAGDNVNIIKDLPVKGSSLVIKRGTAVRNIGLTDNPLHIQGRANGTAMVIISAYCKKM